MAGEGVAKSTGEYIDQSTQRTALTLTLLAAFLGWLFDGFEQGLFPVVARPEHRSACAGLWRTA